MRRGRFSALDGPVKNGYTGGVKDCCGRPPPEDHRQDQREAGTVFHTAVRPRRYGYGRISATGNCVWAVREVSFSTAENRFTVEVEPQARGDASPAYAPVGQLQV